LVRIWTQYNACGSPWFRNAKSAADSAEAEGSKKKGLDSYGSAQ